MSVHSSSTRDSTFIGVDYDDEMKPMGRFGAPKCRWTNGVIALFVSMAGLVLLGVGACTALFFAHDELVMAPGIVFVIVGFLLLVGGGGYYATGFMCVNKIKHIVQCHGENDRVEMYPDNGNAPSRRRVFQSADERSAPLPAAASQADAPPTYDSVQPTSLVSGDSAQPLTYSSLRSPLQVEGFEQQRQSTGEMAHRHEQQWRMMQQPHTQSPLQFPHFQSPSFLSFGASQQTSV